MIIYGPQFALVATAGGMKCKLSQSDRHLKLRRKYLLKKTYNLFGYVFDAGRMRGNKKRIERDEKWISSKLGQRWAIEGAKIRKSKEARRGKEGIEGEMRNGGEEMRERRVGGG